MLIENKLKSEIEKLHIKVKLNQSNCKVFVLIGVINNKEIVMKQIYAKMFI